MKHGLFAAFVGLLACTSGLLASCSSTSSFTYPDKGAPNFFARASGIRAGFLESRVVNLAIFSEKDGAACNFQYDGTIVLKEKDRGIRIPVGRPVIVQMNVVFTDPLDDADNIISYDHVFVPEAGRQYRAEAKQDDVGLNFRIMVRDATSETYSEVELVGRDSCGPTSDRSS